MTALSGSLHKSRATGTCSGPLEGRAFGSGEVHLADGGFIFALLLCIVSDTSFYIRIHCTLCLSLAVTFT